MEKRSDLYAFFSAHFASTSGRGGGEQAARRCALGHPSFAAGAGQGAPGVEEAHSSRERPHRGCSHHGRDTAAGATRRGWPQRSRFVPRAIRGGAESAEEGAQRSNCPPPQGAGSRIAPSWSASQPDISTLLETGHLYLGLTDPPPEFRIRC